MISAQQRLLRQEEQARQPQPEAIRISPVFSVTLLIFTGFFIVAMSLVLVSRSAGVGFHPLDAYASVLPGQPWANVEAYGFECGLYNHGEYYVEECTLRPETDAFARIGVVRYQDVIDALIFTPRENGLALGELAVGFGAPPRRQGSRNRWVIGDFYAQVWVDVNRFSYFQPIQHLYLNRSLPDRVHD